jgi:hypothetical protein
MVTWLHCHGEAEHHGRRLWRAETEREREGGREKEREIANERDQEGSSN